jgi:hypothetical protein
MNNNIINENSTRFSQCSLLRVRRRLMKWSSGDDMEMLPAGYSHVRFEIVTAVTMKPAVS